MISILQKEGSSRKIDEKAKKGIKLPFNSKKK
jgi:hypothetical protein